MALNAATILMRVDAELQRPFREDLTTENLNLHNELTNKLRDIIQAFVTKEQAIANNRTLSDQGKTEQLVAAGTGTLASLAWLERVVSRLSDQRRGLRTDLFTIKTPARFGTDVYDNGKELRERYIGLTQQERDVVFLRMAEAVAAEDPDDPESVAQAAQEQARRDEVLFAFQETPGPSLVTRNIQVRAMTERAQRLQPAKVAQLQQTDVMHEVMNGVKDHVILWLRGLGVDPKKIFDQLGGPVPPTATTQADKRMVSA